MTTDTGLSLSLDAVVRHFRQHYGLVVPHWRLPLLSAEIDRIAAWLGALSGRLGIGAA